MWIQVPSLVQYDMDGENPLPPYAKSIACDSLRFSFPQGSSGRRRPLLIRKSMTIEQTAARMDVSAEDLMRLLNV